MFMEKRAHIIVKGLVQGVFFRASTRRIAKSLGLKGYVKNLENGNVEIIVEGNEEAIKELINFAKKGPEPAEVRDINIKYEEPKNEFESFGVY